MIKFVANNKEDNTPLVGLGLTPANWAKLMNDQPIQVDVAELIPGHNLKILIFAGKDEQAMTDQFKAAGFLGPDVKINKVPGME